MRMSSQSIQSTGGSRFWHSSFVNQWRLSPVGHALPWAHMRGVRLFCFLAVGFLAGCSTFGPVRVSVRLPGSSSVTAGSATESPAVRQATLCAYT